MGKSYRDLIAWQKAIELVAFVYSVSRSFPGDELYGLTAQIRRAAVSIPSNIAEGQGRKSHAEFRHFLRTACVSVMEVETQATIARVLGYIKDEQENEILHMTAELGRILNGLVNSLADDKHAAGAGL